jgi:aminomethyltransferase
MIMKRTPLFDVHQQLGAKLIEFGGWEMPVYYSGIVAEHLAVRQAAGLFDISHMGEVFVRGPGAAAFLNYVLTNDVGRLRPGQGQYSLMCKPSGGVVDDLYVYCLAPEEFLLVVNAARIRADVAWLQEQCSQRPDPRQVRVEDASEQWGAIAVQGPASCRFIEVCCEGRSDRGTAVSVATELKKNEVAGFRFRGEEVFVARTGYTGEDGFEVVAPAGLLAPLWTALLEAGRPFGAQPAGLGARDTLRTEVCYPLYGHELDENTTPLEAGLGFFVALEKGDFIGRSALIAQKEAGVSRKLAAFKMIERSAPPRPQYAIWKAGADGMRVGVVTSGTQSPSLGIGIGLGYVATECAAPGTRVEIEIRGRRAAAEVVRKPIYRKAD